MRNKEEHRGFQELPRGWGFRRWGSRRKAAATFAASLCFEEVTHSYESEGACSVKKISLTLEPGHILCLLGGSGCGKTTILRLASGIERPRSGRILIDSVEVAGPKSFVPPEKRGIGFVFQDYALFPHMTILQNVAFGLHDLSKSQGKAEALQALERVGLQRYAGDYPHLLSGGEQQRVALARALVPRPGVLLMDEPFSGLDQQLRVSIRTETLAVLRETRATCILVTHDPEEAMQMGDRIALMQKGCLHQIGTAQALYTTPCDIYTARFFSPLNEIPLVVLRGVAASPFGAIPAPEFKEGARVLLCLRPQHLRLCPLEKGLPGRVLSRRFLGPIDQFEIGIQALETPLIIRQSPEFVPCCTPTSPSTGLSCDVGAEIGVEADLSRALLFKMS